LQAIAQAAAGGARDDLFWRSLYKYNSDSGSPWVTGWINAFFAFTYGPDGATPKENYRWKEQRHDAKILPDMFPSHVSCVPFVWEYFGRNIDMTFAAGILGVDNNDGLLAPRLGFTVVER
jgi:hypothetical protein